MTNYKTMLEVLINAEYQMRRAGATISLLQIGNESVTGCELIIDGLNYHADKIKILLEGGDPSSINVSDYVGQHKKSMEEAEENVRKMMDEMEEE